MTAGLRAPARWRGRRWADPGLPSRQALSNLVAQGSALVMAFLASLLVARVGGAAVLGEWTLLRVLPWLFGVVFSCGLPTACAFYLAGEHRADRRLRPTLGLMTVAGAALGAGLWLACTPGFHQLFFRRMPLWLVAAAALLVVTQLCTVTAKACCQGSGDITGANLVIVAEEAWFVLCYPAVLLAGGRGIVAVVASLLISGALAALTGLTRLLRRQFFTGWGLPSPALAKRVAAYGARGQAGNLLWLMNLRFDVVLLGAIAGPAVLGVYAVATKFAELMRLVPTAINYVLYPRFSRIGQEAATAEARSLLPRATALTLAMTPVMAVATLIAIPILYGPAFHGAVLPGEIIIIGLSVEGAAAVASAYLLGSGRPGLNSIGMGAGAAVTVTLDLILIPRYGALGGAITSALTYLTSTAVLVLLYRRVARTSAAPAGTSAAPGRGRENGGRSRPGTAAGSAPGCDTVARRLVDMVVAGSLLLAVSPVLLLVAIAVKADSRGPVFYRQVRVGKSGQPFTIIKFRSMVRDADRRGPLVTGHADPRVTRVGSWLRVSKLDEVPQLFNVLAGDMTLIGPRPEVPRYLPYYRPDELELLGVRPGLTGPGQLLYTTAQAAESAPGADPEAEYVGSQLHPKLALDLDYVKRRSLRLDLAILFQTAVVICRR